MSHVHEVRKKPAVMSFLYAARNAVSGPMFEALRTHISGNVADIGGSDFYETAKKRGVRFDHWTVIEPAGGRAETMHAEDFTSLAGDGCDLHGIADNSFDSALCIQVVEHVFEPICMVREIRRILKPGGKAVFLVPQKSVLHMAPHHYYNFTRFWCREVMKRADFEMLELRPIGGLWATLAAHMIYFFLKVLRYPEYVVAEYRRSAFFYILLPLTIPTALVLLPVFLVFAAGDLKEEASNHLVVVQKSAA